MREFKSQSGIDIHGDKGAMQRVREASEKAKCELSSSTQTTISIPYLAFDKAGPKHLNTTMTRAKLESLLDTLI
jgi:molecular chaperone DnaK